MSRASLLFMARVFDKCRRSDECWETARQFTNHKGDFSPEERQIYAAAYKAYCSDRKMNLRHFNEIEKIEEKERKVDLTPLKELRAKNVAEIKDASLRCLEAIGKFFGPSTSAESDITSTKLKGDACKFLYDVETGEERKKYATMAHECFEAAHARAESKLKATHPVRLGVALAYSGFLDGVLRDTISACKVAKASFDEGTAALNEKDEFFQDASALLNMLKESLTFWTSELEKNLQ
jgi:14-3-3 protein epsilon